MKYNFTPGEKLWREQYGDIVEVEFVADFGPYRARVQSLSQYASRSYKEVVNKSELFRKKHDLCEEQIQLVNKEIEKLKSKKDLWRQRQAGAAL